MNANEVIESYVADVAVQLPRKQRNDVAFELRALLHEELLARAEDGGRAVDATLAIELLQAFGRPEDVAARYQPALTIIDPADGHRFLRATLIGLAIIWSLGLWACLQAPIGSGGAFLRAIGQWWGQVVIPSLWWPGMLVVGFAIAAWARRRWPQTAAWQPRASDRLQGGRVGKAMALLGVLCGVYLLVDPRWILDVAFNGRAAPAAYTALTYTDTFLQRQAPWLLALLLLNVPLFALVIVHGRWSPLLRRIETVHSLVLCAVMAWTVFDGPIFLTIAADKTAKFFLVLLLVSILITLGLNLHRRVRPRPN
ncbi:hypothetical protein [Arenimonas oryziterrae]|uniref:Uncharacterized protein n=1 Tax=Arenimonas oryziterrae DSM 21050 = YC6267 TaxID=1121015 RepID=A0A091AUX9_9GAMM|nr:hypothetical protein [Arenimonas oryziterrae]KFN43062.1 hypothetical protein N789_10900 [Arenimonas oryziterrae DSM 21050 = YC6267]